MADLVDTSTVKKKNEDGPYSSEAHGDTDHREHSTVAVGALSSRRPSAEIEAQIDAAIESRRKQAQILDARNVREVVDRTLRPAPVGDFEYLDHTADIQLHSWGTGLERALESLVLAMFGYMTDLSGIELQQEQCVGIQGHDAPSMVFLFLQEWLTLFHETGFVPRKGTEIKAVTYSNLQVREPPNKGRCDIWVIVDI